jgi:hypothetical protein
MHMPRSHLMEDNIHLSVPFAQRRCAASLGALSAQYSNLAPADSKPKAAQCGASDASLQDGSGSPCTRTRTRARARAFLAGVCECGVLVRWTCPREPHVDTPSTHAGHHVLDRSPGWDPVRGGIFRVVH